MPLPQPKAVLIDMAGVLNVGEQAIPGSVDALHRLRASRLPLRFLTNTTRSPQQTILQRMAAIGFPIQMEEIFTAPQATRKLLQQRNLHPYYLVHPDIADEMGPSAEEPDAVVLGDAGETFTYARLNEAFRHLMRGLPLIAMARNRYFKEPDGLSLDMGAFVAALEYGAGIQAEVVGKPSRAYFDTALHDLGVAAADAVMIGDDISDDIDGAQQAGIAGILVRTGKFRSEDEGHAHIWPKLIVDDFAAAVKALLD